MTVISYFGDSWIFSIFYIVGNAFNSSGRDGMYFGSLLQRSLKDVWECPPSIPELCQIHRLSRNVFLPYKNQSDVKHVTYVHLAIVWRPNSTVMAMYIFCNVWLGQSPCDMVVGYYYSWIFQFVQWWTEGVVNRARGIHLRVMKWGAKESLKVS